MSRLIRCCFVVLLGAVLPSVVRAQDQRELARRLDALASRRDEAKATYYQYRVRTAEAYSDTVIVGNGMAAIAATKETAPIVRAAAVRTDSFLAARFGPIEPVRSDSMMWTIRADSESRRRGQFLVSQVSKKGLVWSPDVGANVDDVTRFIENMVQWTLLARGGLGIGSWLPGALPIDSASDESWRSMRYTLAASATSVARECYVGKLAACKSILGLSGSESYSPDFFGAHARGTLVQLAVTTGGRGALGRLIANKASTEGALTAASKIPIDSLVAHWQRNVHDGGATSEAFTPVIAMVAIGWIVVMGLLSLRSSRWR
jgi:hypothetical protein